MALARSRRNEAGFNYWPGFVAALSTLVLSIVFLLSVFLVVQFFLSQEVTGKDKALEQLNAKLAQLNDLLSLEKLSGLNLNDQLSQARAGLASVEAERDRIKGLYDGLAGAGSSAEGRATELNKALDSEKQVSSRALATARNSTNTTSRTARHLCASGAHFFTGCVRESIFTGIGRTLAGDETLKINTTWDHLDRASEFIKSSFG